MQHFNIRTITLNDIPKILTIYRKYLETAEDDIRISCKTLEEINREHAQLYVYYNERMVELGTLVKYVKSHLAKRKAEVYYRITKESDIQLTDTQKEKLIQGEDDYIEMYMILIEVEDTYGKFKSLDEGFRSRGYALTNITKSRIAGIDNVVL